MSRRKERDGVAEQADVAVSRTMRVTLSAKATGDILLRWLADGGVPDVPPPESSDVVAVTFCVGDDGDLLSTELTWSS